MTHEQQALIDEFGELDRQVLEFKPRADRHKKLKDTIAGWFGTRPDEQCEAEGQLYRVRVGPRAVERKITKMRALYRFLGLAEFLRRCTFPLKTLDSVADDPSKYVESAATGPRKVVAVLKAAVEKPKARAA